MTVYIPVMPLALLCTLLGAPVFLVSGLIQAVLFYLRVVVLCSVIVCVLGGGGLLVRSFFPVCLLVRGTTVVLVRDFVLLLLVFSTFVPGGGGSVVIVRIGIYVTFPGIGLSRGIPVSLILVCTSGPQRSGMFRWSW